MVGYFTRVLPPAIRVGFVAAGVMLLLPHQASQVMLWLNMIGFGAAMALVAYEMRWRKAYVRP